VQTITAGFAVNGVSERAVWRIACGGTGTVSHTLASGV
jgi:hypothetical protein